MAINNILEDKNFVKKEVDLSESHGFKVLGFFPYATKYVSGDSYDSIVSVPRQMFSDLEQKIGINDNKTVVVCQDTVNFGTDNFVIQFKDFFCRLGYWNQVKDY